MACKCKKWDAASTYILVEFILATLIFLLFVYLIAFKKKILWGTISTVSLIFVGAGIALYWRRFETASVRNCSEYLIIGKAEDGQYAILINPGEEVSGIDGVWVPWNPDCVLKIPNGVHVCISEHQERFPTILSEISFRNMEGGWYKPERLGWEMFFSTAREMFEEMQKIKNNAE